MSNTLGGLEMDLYSKRPDLWALSKALKLAPAYKPEIWALLSEKDKQSLMAYSARLKAIQADTQAIKENASRR